MLSLNKRATSVTKELPKPPPKPTPSKPPSTFNRVESGRFSMRTPRTATTPNSAPKSGKKDGNDLDSSAFCVEVQQLNGFQAKTPNRAADPGAIHLYPAGKWSSRTGRDGKVTIP